MPNLIQVPPGSVSEFLADGNTQAVPAVQASDVNDGDLLNATRTVDLGSGYKFEIILPSGRVLESAPVGNDYPKRDAILQWLDAVRNSIVEDSANAARAARDAHLSEPLSGPGASDASPANLPGTASIAETIPDRQFSDPVEYARSQLLAASKRLSELTAAERDVERWRRVLASLTGESTSLPLARRKKRRKKRAIKKPTSEVGS